MNLILLIEQELAASNIWKNIFGCILTETTYNTQNNNMEAAYCFIRISFSPLQLSEGWIYQSIIANFLSLPSFHDF